MPDFNPNEVDALFREGAERHEFEYNSDAWALMEEKLDNKSRKKRILFLLLGLLLLVSTVVSYTYLNNESERDLTDIDIATNVKESTIVDDQKQDIIEGSLKEDIVTNQALNDTNIQPKIKNESISTDSKESSSNIGAQNSFQSENTGNLIGNEIVSISSQTESQSNEHQVQDNTLIHKNDEINSNQNLQSITSINDIEVLSIPSLGKKDIELFELDVVEFNTSGLKPTHTPFAPILLPNSNRFALTVFANPEWSSVGLFRDSKAGWSVGTKIGYQFADKFEVSVGLAFSRKIYKGAGTEYTMPGGWFNDLEPMQMDAKCDVIEIPIGLSYYANGFRNSGFFTELGINSYMLHSEWYGFEYEKENALVVPDRYKEVIEEDENTHLVGVGRFAIGYQKVLSNNTSFQIAPYLQFPLTGIGAGKVNLYSSGVQIAVKFNTK